MIKYLKAFFDKVNRIEYTIFTDTLEVFLLEKNSYILVSKYVKNERKRLGISQERMANILTISLGTLKKIESIEKNKNYKPSYSTLKKIKKILNSKENQIIDEILLSGISKNTEKKLEIKEEKMLTLLYEMETRLKNEILKSLKAKEEKPLKAVLENEVKKINSLKNDYETINRIIKIMWILNDEANKYFTELSLLLSTNDIKSNLKIKKGLLEVANNLFTMGEKLKKFLDEEVIINI